MDPERRRPLTCGTTRTIRSKGACRLKTPSSFSGHGDLVGRRPDAEGFAGSDNAHLHACWQNSWEKLHPLSEAFTSCETWVYLLPAGQLGLRAAAAFAGAASQLRQPQGEVLTCPDILILSRKEGRVRRAGSRAERKQSCGWRVGMGSGASLLPGKQRTPSTKPSRSWGREKVPSLTPRSRGQDRQTHRGGSGDTFPQETVPGDTSVMLTRVPRADSSYSRPPPLGSNPKGLSRTFGEGQTSSWGIGAEMGYQGPTAGAAQGAGSTPTCRYSLPEDQASPHHLKAPTVHATGLNATHHLPIGEEDNASPSKESWEALGSFSTRC